MSTEQTISNNHPDEAILVGYIESPKSDEFQFIRRHLISCPVCRKKVTSFQTMLHLLKSAPPMTIEKQAGEHPDEIDLADYVEKRLSSDQYNEIKQHILGCGYCTRAVLHYSTSTAEMEKDSIQIEETVSIRPKPKNIRTGDSLSTKLRHAFSWRMPVWIGVPATALAAVALFFIIMTGEKDRLSIVSFQDRPIVVLTAPGGDQPGIGFMGSARERSIPFEGIKINPEDDTHLRLKWSKIENALFYEVKIYSTNDPDHTLIGQAEPVGLTETIIQVSALTPGKPYTWELSGKMKDGGRFLTRGEFVVAEPD